MRKTEKEITSRQEILDIIQKAVVCRLGLIDRDEPYIVPMNFGYQDNSLYLHSATEGRKIDIIKKNNIVCFELETDVETISGEKVCQWSMKYRCVMGKGKAYILEGNEAKAKGLNIVINHYTKGKIDASAEILDKVAIIRVDIEELTGKKSKN